MALVFVSLALACTAEDDSRSQESPAIEARASLTEPQEVHLRNATQLTFGGENAEAYFSADDRYLILQSTHGKYGCDQIFTLPVSGGQMQLVSTGNGRTTCSYFFPAGDRILYSSTHAYNESCPPPPDYSMGYVWALYPEYEIFVADRDGGNLVQLTDT